MTCTPATDVAVVYDTGTQIVQMVIVPDCKEQLDDPAFKPKGTVMVKFAKPVYNAGLKSAMEQLLPNVKLQLDPAASEPPKPCTENCEPAIELPVEEVTP